MKRKKQIIRLPLQFFGEGGDNETATGTALPEGNTASIQPTEASAVSADAVTETGDKLEEEFEKLIKGGIYEPAFKKRVQAIIDKRFKHTKTLEEERAAAQPIFDLLSETYGTDSSSPALLLEKMQNDTRLKKTDSAVGGDNVTDGTSDAGNDSAAGNDSNGKNGKDGGTSESARKSFLEAKATALYRRWTAEGQELKALFPAFDFKTELRDPAFTALLKSGMSVKRAYTALHSDELIKKAVSGTARAVAEQSLKSIRAQGRRPSENGLERGGGMISHTDVSSLTGKDIRDIIKQVENGSKIRF